VVTIPQISWLLEDEGNGLVADLFADRGNAEMILQIVLKPFIVYFGINLET